LGPAQNKSVTEVAWPFFAATDEPNKHVHAVRPLYNYESDAERGTKRLQYLWPLGLSFSREGDRRENRLWPLFSHVRYERPGQPDTTQGFFLFLVHWGYKPPGGSYFGIFPLGGLFRGVIGDEFTFVIFPLFSKYRRGQYVRYDALWPFFSWGRSPANVRKTTRTWPFWGRYTKQGQYDRSFALWPLLRWGRENMTGRYPQSYFQFWPFYASKVAKDEEGKEVAYHKWYFLFSHRRDTRERHMQHGWAFMWVLKFLHAPSRDIWRVAPFYWRTVYYLDREKHPERNWTRHRILWPIIWYDDIDTRKGVHRRNFVVAPFYWDYATRHKHGQERASRSITLWPLVTWERDLDGSTHLWILSHGWEDPPQGYKRNYRPFFDWFQRHRGPDKGGETRLLWRLYHHRYGERGRHLTLGPFFTYDSRRKNGRPSSRNIQLFGGLIQVHTGEKDTGLRLFYIPIGIP
jgi:hypothetical protein